MNDTAIRLRRSALYMPASNMRAIDKPRTLPRDVVILDLNDAAAPDEKPAAHAQAVAAAGAGGFGARELVIRCNALDSPCGQNDLKALRDVRVDAPSPTEAALSWSRTILETFARPKNAGRGAIRVEGKMVERLHLEQLRRTCALAAAARAA